jgi:hypothetical protein
MVEVAEAASSRGLEEAAERRGVRLQNVYRFSPAHPGKSDN